MNNPTTAMSTENHSQNPAVWQRKLRLFCHSCWKF